MLGLIRNRICLYLNASSAVASESLCLIKAISLNTNKASVIRHTEGLANNELGARMHDMARGFQRSVTRVSQRLEMFSVCVSFAERAHVAEDQGVPPMPICHRPSPDPFHRPPSTIPS